MLGEGGLAMSSCRLALMSCSLTGKAFGTEPQVMLDMAIYLELGKVRAGRT